MIKSDFDFTTYDTLEEIAEELHVIYVKGEILLDSLGEEIRPEEMIRHVLEMVKYRDEHLGFPGGIETWEVITNANNLRLAMFNTFIIRISISKERILRGV